MANFIKKYWFFGGMLLVIVLAFQFPGAGAWIQDGKILKVAIFIAFFISGLSLDTGQIGAAVKNFKALVGAIVSSFLLFPLLALGLAYLCYGEARPLSVGIVILAVCPVTLVSGIVLTDMAKGNTALSIFICIASNVTAIFTMPLSLNFLLQTGQSIDLPILQMIRNLVIVVLVPMGSGQFLRRYLKQSLKPLQGSFNAFSQLLVLLIVFNAVSTSQARILQLGWNVGLLLLMMILLHALALLMNLRISKVIRLDRPATIAFTIQTSQKALVVAYLVWLDFFSVDYPIALIPAAAYHLIQIVIDALLARKIAQQTSHQSS